MSSEKKCCANCLAWLNSSRLSCTLSGGEDRSKRITPRTPTRACSTKSQSSWPLCHPCLVMFYKLDKSYFVTWARRTNFCSVYAALALRISRTRVSCLPTSDDGVHGSRIRQRPHARDKTKRIRGGRGRLARRRTDSH